MAIFTPRGLKVRLPAKYAFALMDRLYPDVSAFRVLKTTEGIGEVPAVGAFVAGMVSFFSHQPPVTIGAIVFISSVFLGTLTRKGLYLIPGLVAAGTVYSYLSGFGLLFVLIAIVGYFAAGWRGAVAFFTGRLLAGAVGWLADLWRIKKIHSATGMVLTASEWHFINAYQLHASRLGFSTDPAVAEDEANSPGMGVSYWDLATHYPEVVARFTPD